ncbi:hypothetical protein D3C85_418810 [compost metagenome]
MAPETADIGVVDVAVDHVGDDVPVYLPAQLVGGGTDMLEVRIPRLQQRHHLGFIQILALQSLGHRGSYCRPDGAQCASWCGRCSFHAGRPRIAASKALCIAGLQQRCRESRIDPLAGVDDVWRVDGKTRHQHPAMRGRVFRE